MCTHYYIAADPSAALWQNIVIGRKNVPHRQPAEGEGDWKKRRFRRNTADSNTTLTNREQRMAGPDTIMAFIESCLVM